MAERVNGRYKVGQVGVDAGMVMVGDPCYLDKFTDHDFDDAKVEAQKASGKYDYSYSGACAATLSDNGAGQLGIGDAVAVSSGYGDGVYPVYATYNHEGRIVKLEVIFEADSDEDDWNDDEIECEDCGGAFEQVHGEQKCESCRDDLSCHECDGALSEDEAIWATADGVLTMKGNPYCDGCLPEEKEAE